MQRQLAVMSHVMFGGITHMPAIDLARRLIPLVPEGLDHLFTQTQDPYPWKSP